MKQKILKDNYGLLRLGSYSHAFGHFIGYNNTELKVIVEIWESNDIATTAGYESQMLTLTVVNKPWSARLYLLFIIWRQNQKVACKLCAR